MSNNVTQLTARLAGGVNMTDEELDTWIQISDITNAGQFFGGDARAVYEAVRQGCQLIVLKYLNNSSVETVPLRRRTKFCLVLNNFALYPPVRSAVFDCLEGLTQTFEKAITEEGTMPFDQELGRMSEHVLVLLMRVMSYDLKAAAVHEFAEGNIQFGIQLLLAILLKEPPYETPLRFNCISGLLGFTQPQTFFGPGKEVEEHSCTSFTEKVNFMMDLMLRLQAVQVVSDVLTEVIQDAENPSVANAVIDTMRTIMNIFRFSSQGASFSSLQWRQHILLSTTFMDGTVVMFTQGAVALLDEAIRKKSAIPKQVIPSLDVSFRFGAFCTYHLGHAAEELRLYCTFFHDLFSIPLRPMLTNTKASTQVMSMYVNLLHFMCNVDALGGEADLPQEDLLPELSSEVLKRKLETYFRGQLAPCGLPTLTAWQTHFRRVDTTIMVSYDSRTYQILDAMFTAELSQLSAQQCPPPSASSPNTKSTAGSLLGEMPALKPSTATPAHKKMSIALAAEPVREKLSRQTRRVETNQSFLCALTGNVMKNPVSSPYGHTFEKEDILRWLEQNGSVCPITGKSLTADQLKPNAKVAALVMQRIVQESMKNNDDDLYNF